MDPKNYFCIEMMRQLEQSLNYRASVTVAGASIIPQKTWLDICKDSNRDPISNSCKQLVYAESVI